MRPLLVRQGRAQAEHAAGSSCVCSHTRYSGEVGRVLCLACLTICTRTMLILFMKILSERKSSSLLERWMTRLTTNALIPAHCGVDTARGQAGLPTPSTHSVTSPRWVRVRITALRLSGFEDERAPALLAATSIEI